MGTTTNPGYGAASSLVAFTVTTNPAPGWPVPTRLSGNSSRGVFLACGTVDGLGVLGSAGKPIVARATHPSATAALSQQLKPGAGPPNTRGEGQPHAGGR